MQTLQLSSLLAFELFAFEFLAFVVLTSSLRLEKNELIDKKIDVILEYSQTRRMILILNVDEWYSKKILDVSTIFEIEFWRIDIWFIFEVEETKFLLMWNEYDFAMFSKEINDFNIETRWILNANKKIFKLEMILTFWLDIEFIEWTEEWHWFVRRIDVIFEYSQAIQMMLISNAERKRSRRFLMFLMQWSLMQNSEDLILSLTSRQKTNADLLDK